MDSLTGAVASQKVTEALKGSLSTVGNRTKSVKAKESLIARHTGRARTKVGLSDPVVPHGRAIAQRIQVQRFVPLRLRRMRFYLPRLWTVFMTVTRRQIRMQ